jgi:hypothetical protein
VYPKLLSRWPPTPYVDVHSRLASVLAQGSVCEKEVARTWRSSSSLTDLSSLKLFLIETGISSSPPSSTFGVILGDARSESNGWSGVDADIGFEILGAAKRTVSTRETQVHPGGLRVTGDLPPPRFCFSSPAKSFDERYCLCFSPAPLHRKFKFET